MKKKEIFLLAFFSLTVLTILVWKKSKAAIPYYAEETESQLVGVEPPRQNDIPFVNPAKQERLDQDKLERRMMSPNARIALLEALGCVPIDGERVDFFLAEKTSWWGKRLDSAEFWKGRIIWYDDKVQRDAKRHGRAYPPMPYEDPALADRSAEDKQANGNGGESRTPRSFYSDRESAFWDKFIKTHPHPPEDISSWVKENAMHYQSSKRDFEHPPIVDPRYGAKLEIKPRPPSFGIDLREAKIFNYPPECINEDTYYWTQVMAKREEYEKDIKPWESSNPNLVDVFFKTVYVDRKLITEPLTAENIKAANAWKVAYLKRLRAEKWDESYINAYKEAWSLTESDLVESDGKQE